MKPTKPNGPRPSKHSRVKTILTNIESNSKDTELDGDEVEISPSNPIISAPLHPMPQDAGASHTRRKRFMLCVDNEGNHEQPESELSPFLNTLFGQPIKTVEPEYFPAMKVEIESDADSKTKRRFIIDISTVSTINMNLWSSDGEGEEDLSSSSVAYSVSKIGGDQTSAKDERPTTGGTIKKGEASPGKNKQASLVRPLKELSKPPNNKVRTKIDWQKPAQVHIVFYRLFSRPNARMNAAYFSLVEANNFNQPRQKMGE